MLKYSRTKAVLTLVLILCTVSTLFTAPTAKAAESTSWIRGVNLPAIWFDSQSYSVLPTIKNDGFNTVRIVWLKDGSASRLDEYLTRCESLGLKPIAELHDATGSNNASDLNSCVDYWIRSDIMAVIKKHSTVWINIANEWGPANSKEWCDAYVNSVQRLRNAGFSGAIVVDAGGWGQDDKDITNYAKTVMKADIKDNTIFSIHMYGSWNSNSKIYNFLNNCVKSGIPIMVGEFGYNYRIGLNNLLCRVDAEYVIKTCKSLGVGYIPWSWSGNNSENAWLDMTTNFGSYTSWGKLIKDSLK